MDIRDDIRGTTQWIEDLVVWLGVRRDSDLFEDCVQEAWLGMLMLDKRTHSNEAYQSQAAKWNILIMLGRERAESNKHSRMQIEMSSTLEDLIMEALERDSQLAEFAETMSLQEMLIYVLAVYSPFSQRQIGEVLGLSPRTLRRKLKCALRKSASNERAQEALSVSANRS